MDSKAITTAEKPVPQAQSDGVSSPIQRALTSGVLTQSPIITLVVGDAKVEYKVHQVLLCNESEFFRGCLQTQFFEASTAVVPLPKDSTCAVETFLRWLYSGRYDVREHENIEVADWSFGDKYCSDSYCNTIVNETKKFCKANGFCYTTRTAQTVYDLGLRGKPFADYVLQSVIYGLHSTEAEEGLATMRSDIAKTTFSQELSVDLILQMLAFRKEPWDDPSRSVGCHFHVGDRCCSAKATK